MRGARETVAKALALECMRAAKAQERGCYVFAFAGPQEVGQVAGCCGGWIMQLFIRPATVVASGVQCVCLSGVQGLMWVPRHLRVEACRVDAVNETFSGVMSHTGGPLHRPLSSAAYTGQLPPS